MASHSLYSSLPLLDDRSVRLLCLAKSERNPKGPLTARLEVVSLDDSPEYATLSYCWGPPVFSHEVRCSSSALDDANGSTTVLAITKTLYNALVNLRSHGVSRIWVDQVCINQRDDAERSKQVVLMSQIYSRSNRTYIYLGESDDEPEIPPEAMQKLMAMNDFIDKEEGISDERRKNQAAQSIGATEEEPGITGSDAPGEVSTEVTDAKAAKHAKTLDRMSKRYEDLLKGALEARQMLDLRFNVKIASRAWAALMQRSCFTRKWIIQEVVLSGPKTCLAGSGSMDWDVMKVELEAITIVLGYGYPYAEARREAERIKRHAGFIASMAELQKKKPMSLLSLLKLSRFFDATDPRDMIYALLGLARDADKFPAPNYKSPLEQVFREFTLAFLRQGMAFKVLPLAGISKESTDHPSWAVDWGTLRQSYTPRSFGLWRASSDPERFTLEADGRTLLTEGRFVRTVVAVTPSLQSRKVSLIENFLTKCYETFGQYFADSADEFAVYKASLSMLGQAEEGSKKSRKQPTHDDDASTRSTRSEVEHAEAVASDNTSGIPEPEARTSDSDSASIRSDDSNIFESRLMNDNLDNLRSNPRIVITNPAVLKTSYRMLWRFGTRKLDEKLATKEGKMAGFARKMNSKVRPETKTPQQFLDEVFSEGLKEVADMIDDGNSNVYRLLFGDTRVMYLGDGKLALAPGLTEEGDEVWVIAGLRAPFVLRPCGERYQVVGGCYVPEYMNGEACEGETYPTKSVRLI
ncbi:MAG: hypothetical protein MMC23_002691 [Stictis urceolatum]|nr:hypothetical protein [Stictis urceolata]